MKRKLNKKLFIASLLVFVFVTQFYSMVENAFAVTDNVVVTLTVDESITISDGAAITMAPNISVSANGSIGSSSWTVVTNSDTGYNLVVGASTTPALVHSNTTDSFANYTEASAGVPEAWSVPAAAKEFGYSAYGTDTATGTWGTAATCGAAGVPSGTQLYVGFVGTATKNIATRASVTPVAGIATTFCVAAEQDTVFAPAGVYTATITGTATVI